MYSISYEIVSCTWFLDHKMCCPTVYENLKNCVLEGASAKIYAQNTIILDDSQQEGCTNVENRWFNGMNGLKCPIIFRIMIDN